MVCLSKLAMCPCVEHAHQTSSTLPVWHMHARHVQWHPHNKLATERINFLVHYSTDVCFNAFLCGTPSFTKKANTGKWKLFTIKSEYSTTQSLWLKNLHLMHLAHKDTIASNSIVRAMSVHTE